MVLLYVSTHSRLSISIICYEGLTLLCAISLIFDKNVKNIPHNNVSPENIVMDLNNVGEETLLEVE